MLGKVDGGGDEVGEEGGEETDERIGLFAGD